MNILYIWDADYPWDIRVSKICQTLHDNGHTVHIAARNLKKNTEYQLLEGLNIHRLKSIQNDKLNYILSFPVFFSPVWKKLLDKIIKTHHIDQIIVRDLPMAIAGIWAGKRNKIPVIFDMAEDYVSLVKDIWKTRKYHGLNLLVRNPYLAKLVELYTFKNIDHVIVVVSEAVDIVKNINKNACVTIVSNTPELNKINFISTNKVLVDRVKNKYSVIYTGGIQLGRGIQIVLDAIPDIIKIIPEFQFVIVGDGYASEQIKQMIIDKGVEKYVFWVGWQNHDDMLCLIRESKVGIIPHFTSAHVNTTIPNKIFDYMACGLPVISSDAIPMKRILDEEKCGITFESGNSKDLANSIVTVYKSSYNFGVNGINAVKTKYNWEEDAKRLVSVVESF